MPSLELPAVWFEVRADDAAHVWTGQIMREMCLENR